MTHAKLVQLKHFARRGLVQDKVYSNEHGEIVLHQPARFLFCVVGMKSLLCSCHLRKIFLKTI